MIKLLVNKVLLLDDKIEIHYGYASTAFTKMTGCEDTLKKYGVDSFAPVSEAFAARSENDTKGLMLDRLALESVIVKFNIEDNVIKEVLLYPTTLGLDKTRSRKGRPELADEENGTRILQELQGLCDEYGTKIIIEKGIGKIIL